MLGTLQLRDVSRGVLLALGLLLGLVLAVATAGLSWEAGAAVLGLALAALVGIAQTCSA